MDRDLQIWLIVVSVALIASVAIQLFIIGRLLVLVRFSLGRHNLHEIVDKAFDALDRVDRTTEAANQLLEQIRPTVDQVAGISQRQLPRADQVVGEVLTSVQRINHDVNAAISWPSREAHAWSAGVRSALSALFRKDGDPTKGQQW